MELLPDTHSAVNSVKLKTCHGDVIKLEYFVNFCALYILSTSFLFKS